MTLAPSRIEYERRQTLATPRPIPVTRLQTTVSTVATARSDADFRVDSLFAAASTGTGDTITLYLVPDGETAGASNILAFEQVVDANGRVVLFTREYPLLLSPGDTLQALCGTNDAVHVYGTGTDYRGDYGI